MSEKRIVCTVPGHEYGLKCFEKEEYLPISFIHKKPIEEGSTTLQTVFDGTTNEAVIEMLIDRISFLQNAFPCRENALVITKLQESLFWLEFRTADRLKRNVEGKNEK